MATRFASPLLGLLLVACGGSDDEAPAIQSFAAASAEIEEGESTTLNAVFSGGAGTVDQDVGAVQSGTPVTVRPGDDTVYALTVAGQDGRSASASTAVRIVYDERWEFDQVDGWSLDGATVAGGRLRVSASQGEGSCDSASAQRTYGDTKLLDGRYQSLAISVVVDTVGGSGMGSMTVAANYHGVGVHFWLPDFGAPARTFRVEFNGDRVDVLVDGTALPPTAFQVSPAAGAPNIAFLADACGPDQWAAANVTVDSVDVSAR